MRRSGVRSPSAPPPPKPLSLHSNSGPVGQRKLHRVAVRLPLLRARMRGCRRSPSSVARTFVVERGNEEREAPMNSTHPNPTSIDATRRELLATGAAALACAVTAPPAFARWEPSETYPDPA